jgi:predicted transcriptional regulator
MMLRRSRLERHIDVLKVIAQHGPIRQTHVMYKANLSWQELKHDLQNLAALGLVTQTADRDGLHHSVTPLGRDLLEHVAQVEKTLFPDAPSLTSVPF